MIDFDYKLLDLFKGYVVRKDIVRSVKGGANVPVFVLEYLLANSCSTDDEQKIAEGIENVKRVLREHYVNPDEANLIQAKIREMGSYKIIDKISVRLDAAKDKYWAELSNTNIREANISDELVSQHDKMMMGGIWAVIDIEYDSSYVIANKIYPFCISKIRPIQLSNFDDHKIRESRSLFTDEEWMNLMLRSGGYEPESEGMTERMKMLLLSRFIPLVESNFNMAELGPRSSGKSFVFKELSPYSMLVSGGQGTAASLFVNNANGQIGAMGKWDAVCFDESTDELFKDREVVPLMKDYMESGSFSRAGQSGEKSANASIILNGNINQPVETVLQTSHLFSPFSDKICNDTAFLDRIGFFLPGWEIMKFAPANFTNHFGFSTDFFSEFLRAQRKANYTDAIDEYFILGSQLRQRDTKPVRKTVSGLIKLLHPDGKYTKENLRTYLVWAIEMRRRVKEQLKRIGGMEFWDTNFSYIDKETQEEYFVSVPEERGTNLIEDSPLPPGNCYTAISNGENVCLLKIEAIVFPGNGKITVTGTNSSELKEDIKNIYNYIRANEKTLLSPGHSLIKYDVNIQVSSLLGVCSERGIGSAVFVSIISAIYGKNLKPAAGVIGNISIGGAVERAINFSDRVSLLSDNGAKTVAVPMDNLSELASIPATVLGKTDVPFYAAGQMLLQKLILN
ncbi:protease Lon-related BREX system protein BrxL [Bacteroides ovatus]|uniref:protease Lon-related BREX system protein BrxL n=1 Tax=Bacteroides ovatus TaxID=28116 RepID=UPI00202DF147|nr:protease Lon-related BREX system protein BrxL [Bacteroides ovatus]MCM1720327.1 protease Lon-related BREX system protein BrxL [Bacteroides ovatus]MCM1758234.1 protease Lon-related BREX system protein BrxL [Bacteroides ovatus]MCM1866312.1 protease Lon-related BREX system protein BrxL [Bacteroides ovatus]MCM1912388.1 protease Lon-related BREX system protein BrxL [Bacteroides ovatus]